MSVTLVQRVLPVRALGTVTLGAILVLAAGVAGAAAPLAAVAVAVAIAAVLPGAALVCLGMVVRVTMRGLGVCRCVGMLGLGVLAGGLTAAVQPLLDPAHRQVVATAGLVLAATLLMLGLLQVPGVATSRIARLRLAVDGFSVGLLLALTGWLLVPGLGANRPLAYVAVAIAVTCVAITVAAVLRSGRQRPAMIRCGAGAVVAIVGLALLAGALGAGGEVSTVGLAGTAGVVDPAAGAARWVLLAAAALVISGPPVIWAGARRVDFTPASHAPAASLDESFGGYPMLALPAAITVVAFAYHLVVVGLPDHTTVVLGMMFGATMVVREVVAANDLRRRTGRLAAQEAHLRALVAGTGDVTMVLGEDLVVRWQSPAAQQLGLHDQEVVGRRFTDLVHPNDAAGVVERLRAVVTGAAVPPITVEARIADGSGGWRETESTLSDLRTVPAVQALVVQVRDIGQRRHLERSLHLLASTDQRTGLPNRRELLRSIGARRSIGHRRGALVVIGLHGLTAVSDLRGRPASDAVLVEAAERLRSQLGRDDLAAMLGESRFAVVTGDGPIEAYGLAVRLVNALAGTYELPGRPVQLQASAGLAGLAAGESAEDVARQGDLALRRASQQGADQVEWYDESMEEQLVRQLDLERHLPGAAGRGELDLAYQPVVELAGERPVAVEALVRWRHPVLGRVLPGELIPVADQLRVSGEIGEWVLHTSCRQVAGWRQDGHDLSLAVNVSACQLAEVQFIAGLAAALSTSQTPPERLTIEISTAEIGDDLPAVASRLSQIRGLGVRTALDDVGTSHTDLAWLRRLPLDVVKLATPPAVDLAGGLATAVVELAGRLGLAVVAESLETGAQRDLVRAAGCRYGQGFLIAPPGPAERIEAYLDRARDVEMRAAGSSSQ